jgi:hypothetical protein
MRWMPSRAEGSKALRTAANQSGADEARVDPISVIAAFDPARDGDAAALVRARQALARQSAQWLRRRPLPGVPSAEG